MKKFLVLLAAVVLFIACDYATENVGLNPDVECVFMDPIGWYTYLGDTTHEAGPIEFHFVPETSIDCYLTKMIWEYVDAGGSRFGGPYEIGLYMKIEGKLDKTECQDTFVLYNIQLPLDPVRSHLLPGQSAQALIDFVFVDEYLGDKYDTASVWFGFHMYDTTFAEDPFNWAR